MIRVSVRVCQRSHRLWEWGWQTHEIQDEYRNLTIMPLELQLFHLHKLPKPKSTSLKSWGHDVKTHLACCTRNISSAVSFLAFSPFLLPNFNLKRANQGQGNMLGVSSPICWSFCGGNCVQISISCPRPSSSPSPCQGVPCLCPAALTERGEGGSIWRLWEQITPVVLQGPGGGVGANLFALHKGSLIITNCLVNHKRYLAINGNNNRWYRLCTL